MTKWEMEKAGYKNYKDISQIGDTQQLNESNADRYI
jgi:hypothetical protein